MDMETAVSAPTDIIIVGAAGNLEIKGTVAASIGRMKVKMMATRRQTKKAPVKKPHSHDELIQFDEDKDDFEPLRDEKAFEENERLVDEFYDKMIESGLKDETAARHASNVSLFLNSYLVPYHWVTVEYGPEYIGGFLGNYFVRRCMWSKPSNVKTTATSIKKFYKFLADEGYIDESWYDMVVEEIREDLWQWQEVCALYNDRNTELNLSVFDMEFDYSLTADSFRIPGEEDEQDEDDSWW